ncbi:MAG: efflux RND transporter periplasmic adaptor subunit [Acidobacteriota bacterium]|nr:efflux RND transporter periplasmic adaptor subunit [Acidobacteriota bacterium]
MRSIHRQEWKLGGRHCAAVAIALAVLAGCDRNVLELAGTVERTILEITAPISEVIVEIPIISGARVSMDQELVRLDSEVAEAELKAFEAALAAAQATLVEAEEEFVRKTELSRRRVASKQELGRARRQRDEASAVVAEREARIIQARRRLGDLTLRSHAAGVVDQLPFEVGERVPPGAVVAVVQTDDAPWVRVWLPARAVALLTPDARADVQIEGRSDWFNGRIEEVARQPEFTPHFALTEKESAHLVYRARVVLTDAPADLRPGLPARVKLTLSSPGKKAA